MSDSVEPAETAVLRSTTLHAIPPVPITWMDALLRTIREDLFALKLIGLCQKEGIPVDQVTRRDNQGILSRLARAGPERQTLVCVINYATLRDSFNAPYTRRIARRAARLEGELRADREP